MLFTGLCHAFFWVLNAVVKAFPSAGTFTWLSSASAGIADVMGVIHALDASSSVVTWIAVVGIFLGIWAIITLVVAVRKVYSLFAGGGGL